MLTYTHKTCNPQGFPRNRSTLNRKKIMSTIRTQPLPCGLEREKHIEMLFRAFHRSTPIDGQDSTTRQTPSQDPLRRLHLSHTFQAVALETCKKDKGEQCVVETLPAGLSALETVGHIRITAIPELQGPTCISRRMYKVATETKQLFLAMEESSCVCMQCCGPSRACSLHGFDQYRQNIFLFERPLGADLCCLGCCLMEMRVYTAQRELIGTVHQRWSMFTPYFEVCDSADSPLLRIQGSCCPIRCLSDQEFQVVSMIGERIGTVWKKWPGYNVEGCNMDHEYFGLDVSQNMNVKTKVSLLAAAFLLNFMFFEMS